MSRLYDYAKDGVKERLLHLHPNALMVLCDVIKWTIEKQIKAVITDCVTTEAEDLALNRVSSTHRESRAFDISTRGWTKDNIDECVRIFSLKYRHMAAVGTDGQPRLVYFHNAGTGDHLHFQIHKKFALPVPQFDIQFKA